VCGGSGWSLTGRDGDHIYVNERNQDIMDTLSDVKY
jgi:hypothetical protein